MIFGNLFLGFGNFIFYFFFSKKELIICIILGSISLALNIVFCSFLIPKYGTTGAAISSLISYCSFFIINFVYLFKYLKYNTFLNMAET
ncbi:MAG: polysaccharide biosynthesis C-terminal domain-containing protein [Saprospiraceae bacterium]|nr:polysaccharide biosynthesis C-terminal domain-containing protein [Saprospiraceae bacterium]